MTANKPGTDTTWQDPDDAPELSDAWFETADQHQAGKLVKRGRPPAQNPKSHINIRLDTDVLEKLRSTGPGWQSRVNDLLRKSVGL